MTESEPSTQLPLFYKEIVALNTDLHRTLTVSTSPSGYIFAAETNMVLKLAIAIFILMAMISATSVFAASDQKIGLVDMQRAVIETSEGGAARAEIFKMT